MRSRAVHLAFAVAFAMLAGAAATAAVRQEALAPVAPRLLSQTGLYGADGVTIDSRNRSFSPQYPLWSDGALKRRWVRLPEGSSIDVGDINHWDFPVGTRFWKEFEFGGRRIETRFLWKATRDRWVFASYAWNAAQTDAVLAPDEGIANVAEVAPGKMHSIPGVAECRSCHDSARTEIMGFDALQLSDDRDPNALHADPLSPDMVTLRTLVRGRTPHAAASRTWCSRRRASRRGIRGSARRSGTCRRIAAAATTRRARSPRWGCS